MMYSGLSIPVAIMVFLVVAGAVNQIETGILPIILGGIAAYFASKQLNDIDNNRANAVCRTRNEQWAVPYPVAYGIFRKALQTFLIELPEPKRFTITEDDEQCGELRAYLQLTDTHSALTGDLGKRSVTVYLDANTVNHNSTEAKTWVSWSFRLVGPRFVEGEQAIAAFNKKLEQLVRQNEAKFGKQVAAVILVGLLALGAITATPAKAAQMAPFYVPMPVTQQLLSDLLAYEHSPSQYISAPNGHKFNIGLPGLRGGADSGRPLGVYVAPLDMPYRSQYPSVPDEKKALFAAELHSFVVGHGGGYRFFASQVISGGSLEAAHVSYAQQEQFAQWWWRTHDDRFKATAPMFADWWVHDAILDATNIYEHYEATRDNDRSSTRLMYIDGELSQLMKKQ
jgi:hypothetical protein